MKRCPFCAEEIQDQARKCKHCGEFLDSSGKPTSVSDLPTNYGARKPNGDPGQQFVGLAKLLIVGIGAAVVLLYLASMR